MKKYTLYFLIDKKLNKGQRTAQAAHAAVVIGRDHSVPEGHYAESWGGSRKAFNEWLNDPKLVCLVGDTNQIEQFAAKCRFYTTDFVDSDFEVTTYAVGPVPRGEGREMFAGLRLA